MASYLAVLRATRPSTESELVVLVPLASGTYTQAQASGWVQAKATPPAQGFSPWALAGIEGFRTAEERQAYCDRCREELWTCRYTIRGGDRS